MEPRSIYLAVLAMTLHIISSSFIRAVINDELSSFLEAEYYSIMHKYAVQCLIAPLVMDTWVKSMSWLLPQFRAKMSPQAAGISRQASRR